MLTLTSEAHSQESPGLATLLGRERTPEAESQRPREDALWLGLWESPSSSKESQGEQLHLLLSSVEHSVREGAKGRVSGLQRVDSDGKNVVPFLLRHRQRGHQPFGFYLFKRSILKKMYVYEHFACMYVCIMYVRASRVYSVYRGHWILCKSGQCWAVPPVLVIIL